MYLAIFNPSPFHLYILYFSQRWYHQFPWERRDRPHKSIAFPCSTISSIYSLLHPLLYGILFNFHDTSGISFLFKSWGRKSHTRAFSWSRHISQPLTFKKKFWEILVLFSQMLSFPCLLFLAPWGICILPVSAPSAARFHVSPWWPFLRPPRCPRH